MFKYQWAPERMHRTKVPITIVMSVCVCVCVYVCVCVCTWPTLWGLSWAYTPTLWGLCELWGHTFGPHNVFAYFALKSLCHVFYLVFGRSPQCVCFHGVWHCGDLCNVMSIFQPCTCGDLYTHKIFFCFNIWFQDQENLWYD